MKRTLLFLPVAAFVLLAAVLASGLVRPADRTVRSALIGQPLPAFALPPIVPGHSGVANTDFGKGDEKKLVAQATIEPGPTLISWQHEGLPDIAKAFPNVTPEPPADWPDETYDVIWTFTRTADGWQFAQLPELLLPQDQDSVIKD